MTVAQSIVGFNNDGGRPVDDFYITPPEATKALLAVEKSGYSPPIEAARAALTYYLFAMLVE